MFEPFVIFIRKVLAGFGLEVRRLCIEPDIYHRRGARLLQYATERKVNVLLDIGANQGQYAAAFHDVGFTGRTISFEPVAESFATLQPRAAGRQDWDARQVALGDTDANATIQIGGNRECSSLLPMNERLVAAYPVAASCGEQPVRVCRLDSLRAELFKDTDRFFMKLDVQGYELKVLHGARRTLPRVELIDIELTLVPLYDSQPLFIEVLQFLDEEGFVPVSFENGFSDANTGHALQIDVIFLRKPPVARRPTR